MIIKTIAFGRVWRYECDSEASGGCDECKTTFADEDVPDGWYVEQFDDITLGKVLCPGHRTEAVRR